MVLILGNNRPNLSKTKEVSFSLHLPLFFHCSLFILFLSLFAIVSYRLSFFYVDIFALFLLFFFFTYTLIFSLLNLYPCFSLLLFRPVAKWRRDASPIINWTFPVKMTWTSINVQIFTHGLFDQPQHKTPWWQNCSHTFVLLNTLTLLFVLSSFYYLFTQSKTPALS